MTTWNGYFLVLRQDISLQNWTDLQTLFEDMGTHDSVLPANNNHSRASLDGDAVIYESQFQTDEVSIPAFKQLLADTFDVDVADIEHEIGAEDYAGYGTVTWQFNYPIAGPNRFKVERFGGGGIWESSRQETLAYLSDNILEWE